MRSMQAKEAREAADVSQGSGEQSGPLTPKEFAGQLLELNGQTPGNLEDAGALVGVIGSFEAQDQARASAELRLPELADPWMEENADLRISNARHEEIKEEEELPRSQAQEALILPRIAQSVMIGDSMPAASSRRDSRQSSLIEPAMQV